MGTSTVSQFPANKPLLSNLVADEAILQLWGWAGGQQLFKTEEATSYEKLHWLQQGPQKEKTTCLTTVGNTKKFHRKSRCSTPFIQPTKQKLPCSQEFGPRP